MDWKEFLKPNWEKAIIFLIVFTFFPWPRQIYVTPMFFTTFLFYGPVAISLILSIVFQADTSFGSLEGMLGRLFSGQLLFVYANLIAVIVLSYLAACFVSHKTSFLRPTKTKAILSFAVLLVSFALILATLVSRDIFNENAMTAIVLGPLFLFSIFYLLYSLIKKRQKAPAKTVK